MNFLAQRFQSSPALIILSMILILFEFNAPTLYFLQFHQLFNAKAIFPFSFLVTYSLIFLFLLPFITSRYLSKQSLKGLGLTLPQNRKKVFILIVFSLLLLIPVVFFSAHYQTVQTFYSLKGTPLYFIFFLVLAMPPYYFAEEFFFRGFLFLGLWKKLGWHSYWITEILFTWAHLGKPPIELLLSFPAGMVLNYLTLKTQSIYPAMMVHFTMGILLTLLVTFFT